MASLDACTSMQRSLLSAPAGAHRAIGLQAVLGWSLVGEAMLYLPQCAIRGKHPDKQRMPVHVLHSWRAARVMWCTCYL